MDCAICLEPIEFIQKLTLKCEHMFHKNCINQCKDNCPICRKPLISINSNDLDVSKLLKLINYHDLLDYGIILSIEFIKQFKCHINLEEYIESLILYCEDYNYVLSVINEFPNVIDFETIDTDEFSIEQLYAYRHYVDWEMVDREFNLDELKLFKNHIIWKSINMDDYDYTLDDLILLIDYINWSTFKFTKKFTGLENCMDLFKLLQDNLNADWDYFSKILDIKIILIDNNKKNKNKFISYIQYINWTIYLDVNKDYIHTNDFRLILPVIKDCKSLNWNYVQQNIKFTKDELFLYKDYINFNTYNFHQNLNIKSCSYI